MNQLPAEARDDEFFAANGSGHRDDAVGMAMVGEAKRLAVEVLLDQLSLA